VPAGLKPGWVNPLGLWVPGWVLRNPDTDLQSSSLYIYAKIVKTDGSLFTLADNVTGSEDLFSALFDSVEISMNGVIVSKSVSLYPFKAHILNLLSHGKDYKDTMLTSEFYYPDSKPDVFTSAGNDGFKNRLEFSKLSYSFEMIGKLCESVFQQPKYFPLAVAFRITLRRSDPSLALVGSASAAWTFPYKIQINQALMYVKRHIVNPHIVA